MKNEDVIQGQLNEEGEPTGGKLEKKPSDRETQFSQVVDVVAAAQKEFLSSEDMTIEEAISTIQSGLTELLPKPEPKKEDTMVNEIAETRPPGLSSLGSALGAS